MKKNVGVWIDHRKAVLVFEHLEKQETHTIDSDMEKHVRYAGQSAEHDGKADDQRDRQFAAHLDQYYDKVIAAMGEVDSVMIFGPGEAKSEFKTRLSVKKHGTRILAVEAADKMSDREIVLRVDRHYKESRPGVVI